MSVEKQSNRRKYLPYLIGVLVIVVIGFVVLTIQLSQKVNTIFSNISTVTCVYQINVTAFSDDNGDGLQDTSEAGIAGASVSLQHTKPNDTTPELKVTDSSGAATINADKYCLQEDMLTVNIVPPTGYSATTALSFGPYPVPEFTFASSTAVAQNPIPKQIYVGLHKT